MHEYCVQLAFEQHEYYVFSFPRMNIKRSFKPCLRRNHQSSSRCQKPLADEMDDVIGVNEEVRKHQTKGRRIMAPTHLNKRRPCPSAFVWEAVQNVDSVVCIHVERHQSAGR